MSDITSILELLTLKDSAGVGSSIVNTVTAEPKVVAKLVPALISTITASAKGNETSVVNALNGIEALANGCIIAAEPYLVANLSAVLLAASDKNQQVRAAADAAVHAIITKMNANAVSTALKHLFKAAEIGVAFQTRTLALKSIANLSDVAPEQLGHALPEVVPEVTKSMSETKKEVKEAALAAMTASCDVIGNRDIEHMTGKIVRAITHPDDTPGKWYTITIMHHLYL